MPRLSVYAASPNTRAVSEEQRAKYTPIIDALLKASNLEEVSAKRIRTSLQAAVETDLTEHKVQQATYILNIAAPC